MITIPIIFFRHFTFPSLVINSSSLAKSLLIFGFDFSMVFMIQSVVMFFDCYVFVLTGDSDPAVVPLSIVAS